MYESAKEITLARAQQQASTVFLAKVFNWMAVGLGITGVVAFFTAQTGLAGTIVGSPLFMFGAMAVYGLVTKRDLSGWGSFLFMGLIGIILASIVNIFLKNSSLYWVISLIGVFIFTALTAYDVQKIKKIGEEGIMTQGEDAVAKGSIMGALTLYLDFINLFLMLLRFFGGSRD